MLMLDQCNGNVTVVSRMLKTTREKMHYRIGKYHLH